MSPANVFKHFHSKVVLVDAICERHLEKMKIRLDVLNSDAPAPERLPIIAHRLMELHISALKETPFMFEMIFILSEAEVVSGKRYEHMIDTLFADLIKHGVDAGVYSVDDIASRGRAVAAAFATVLHPLFIVRQPIDELGGSAAMRLATRE